MGCCGSKTDAKPAAKPQAKPEAAEPGADKPWMGMKINANVLDKALATGVDAKGPAQDAGIGDDDIIVMFGGETITTKASFDAAYKKHATVGAKVPIAVLHNGNANERVDATLTMMSQADKKRIGGTYVAGADTHKDAVKEAAH